MNARSILYGTILAFLIIVNGAVRIYVAIPLMPTAAYTEEELNMMWAQFQANARAYKVEQERLADINAAATRHIQAGEESPGAPQTDGFTNTSQGVRIRDRLEQDGP